jgi:hypothetical protein
MFSNRNGADEANNAWTIAGVMVSEADFQSVATTGMDAPRQADGSLPVLPNFRLAEGSDLIDQGVELGLPFAGSAPDLGAFEVGLEPPLVGGGAGGGSNPGGSGSGGAGEGGTPSPPGGAGSPSAGASVAGGAPNAGAGMSAGAGSSMSPLGTAGANGPSADAGGCACRFDQRASRSEPTAILGLLLLGSVLARRRTRR